MQSTATLTSKGQITIPKNVRQILGLNTGSKVLFDIKDNNIVTLMIAESNQNNDPALQSFLDILEDDIAKGKNLSSFHQEIVQTSSSNLTNLTNLALEDIENMDIDGLIDL